MIKEDAIYMYHYEEKKYTNDPSGETWVNDSKQNFSLNRPIMDEEVFFYQDDLCIRDNKKVEFYKYEDDDWYYLEGSDFTIPGKCDQILAISFIGEDFLGTKNGNKVKFYKRKDVKGNYSWEYDPMLDFTIPGMLNGI